MEKYSDKYLNDYAILSKSVVGFEFEFYTEKPYYKLLELLNNYLKPIKVSGYKKYHSEFKPTIDHFKIEPDTSLGLMGVELITGPIPYQNCKTILLKCLKFIQLYCTTDEKCSLHINISFDKEKSEKVLDDVNKVKLLLNVDEDKIYKFFPNRKNNVYSKSVKKLIPFKNYQYSQDALNLIINNLELPDTKYYGINIANSYKGRMEYRYIGGVDYHKKSNEILELLDYFVILTYNSMYNPINDDDIELLDDYLNQNINLYKSFLKLEDFIAQFPSITLESDKNSDYSVMKTVYDKYYDKIYDVVTNIYNLQDCIINLDTEAQKVEIIDANFKVIMDLNNINLVSCTTLSGQFSNVQFFDCDVKNTNMTDCNINGTTVFNSKVENSIIDEGSILTNCYICGSVINGEVKDGVVRNCKIGEFGQLSDNVKIVTDDNNYFNWKSSDDINNGKKDNMFIDKKGKNKKPTF